MGTIIIRKAGADTERSILYPHTLQRLISRSRNEILAS